MTHYKTLKAYTESCGNGSSFFCKRVYEFEGVRIWQATARLWWAGGQPITASGRTREDACRHLGEIIRDWDSQWEVPI